MAPSKRSAAADDKGKGKVSKESPASKDKPTKKAKPFSSSKASISSAASSSSSSTTGDRFFLMKSEPADFSIDQLEACPNQTSAWDGVRNFQARNIMRDQMRVGDLAFFYHSNCKTPGIVGVMEVARTAYPDHTQFDRNSKYYDAGATTDKPRWIMVDVKLKRKLNGIISLEELKKYKEGGALATMVLLAKGRLSVQPVSPDEWKFIHTLIDEKKL